MAKTLRSFPAIADKNSRVLVLGSMPGPEALRRRQYYGFPGNHFWRLTSALLGVDDPQTYSARVNMLKKGGIALWDTISACTRPSALDSDIRGAVPNDITGLLRKYPGIKAVFANGRTAEKTLKKHFENRLTVSIHYLPSSSPANAGIGFSGKLKAWRLVSKYI